MAAALQLVVEIEEQDKQLPGGQEAGAGKGQEAGGGEGQEAGAGEGIDIGSHEPAGAQQEGEVWVNERLSGSDPAVDEDVAAADEGEQQGAGGEEQYIHPGDGRQFVEAEVLPILRQGMCALVTELEKQRLDLAAGKDWQLPDCFLPHDWKPFSPHRWLANWLMEHSPCLDSSSDESYGLLSVLERATLWFDALVAEEGVELEGEAAEAAEGEGEEGGGLGLGLQLLWEKLKVVDEGVDKEWLRGQLGWEEGGGGEGEVVRRSAALGLVESLVHQVAQASGDVDAAYRLDALVHRDMGEGMLDYCNSIADKCRYIYLTLDGGEEGEYPQRVPAGQLLDLLSQGLGMTEDQAMEALEAQGVTDGEQMRCPLFCSFLAASLPPGLRPSDPVLLHVVSSAVAISRGLPSELVSAIAQTSTDPLDEVEPQELVEYARSLPTFKDVPQATTSEVQDYSFSQRTALLQTADSAPDTAPTPRAAPPRKEAGGGGMMNSPSIIQRASKMTPAVVLVDVRTQEELDVCLIPGCIHAPAVANPAAPHGWSLAEPSDVSALRDRVDHASMRGQRLRLILYCNAGQRSGAVAADLLASGQLGQAEVSCLCGGIINYFNLGGCVKDRSGAVVQAVHPGTLEMKRFITRPNKFKIF